MRATSRMTSREPTTASAEPTESPPPFPRCRTGGAGLGGRRFLLPVARQVSYIGDHMVTSSLPGFRDFYPADLALRSHIFRTWREVASRYGFVDYRSLYRRANRLLDEVGLELSPSTPVERLSVAQMQMVEIARALSGESRLLIMDEPTAALTDKEISRLFEIIRRLKERGVTT